MAVEIHPVQFGQSTVHPSQGARIPAIVSKRAYEVYSYIYGPQEAMITGSCRGGFSVGELVCFLYARSFPKEEWRERYREASEGMTLR